MRLRSGFLKLSLVAGFTAALVWLGLVSSQPSVFIVRAATEAATQSAPISLPAGDVARGQYLVTIAGCVGCHGTFKMAGPQGIPLAGGREFDLGPVGKFYAPNLTILQKWAADDFAKALRQGLEPGGRVLAPAMPYYAYHDMSDADVASIAAYLKSVPVVSNDVPPAKPGPLAALALHALPAVSVPSPKVDDSATYGAYLVQHVSECGGCHTPRDAQQNVIAARELQGGTINLGTDQEPLFASPIVGSVLTAEGYTKELFMVAMRTGTRPWGNKLPVQMPWRSFAFMTDSDLTAVWNFLQTKKLDSPWPAPKSIPPAPSIGQPPATPAPTAAK